jgi:small subunit ribosomal protein S18
MARNNDRDRGKRVTKDTRPRGKQKVCIFCEVHTEWVDYKDVNLLRRFMSDRGKIRARRASGNCAQHQREVATAIKTARELALLPYAQRAVSERGAGKGGGGRPGAAPGGSREQAARPDVDLVLDADDGVELDDGDKIAELEAVGAEA